MSRNDDADRAISRRQFLKTSAALGGAIALDASTTLQRLARVMTDARDITVLTNGPETFRSLQAALPLSSSGVATHK